MKFSKYLLDMGLGFVAYTLGLIAYNELYAWWHRTPFKLLLFLLPTLPMLWVVATILRHVTNLDEMQRKIVTQGMAFAGLATAFTCFSLLFARDLGSQARAEWGFYVYWIYYGVGATWASWRVR